jgi:hypothetical protein
VKTAALVVKAEADGDPIAIPFADGENRTERVKGALAQIEEFLVDRYRSYVDNPHQVIIVQVVNLDMQVE